MTSFVLYDFCFLSFHYRIAFAGFFIICRLDFFFIIKQALTIFFQLQACPESKVSEDQKDPEELMEKTANEDLPALTVSLEKTELTARMVSTEQTENLDRKDPLASAARMARMDLLGLLDQLEKMVLRDLKVKDYQKSSKLN